MKNATKLFLATALICSTGLLKADTQTSTYINGKNLFGFSVTESVRSLFQLNRIVAGTVFTPGNPPTDTADIQVIEYDRFGSMRSSFKINNGTNEYCYNITNYSFSSGAGYIISGASLEAGILRPHVWLIDQNGVILAHKVFNRSTASGAAMHATPTSDGNFLVSGFVDFGASGKQGLVMKLNTSLGIVWHKLINSPTPNVSSDWDICEFGCEVDNAYFITGTSNNNNANNLGHVVLALWLNKTTGAIVTNKSFAVSGGVNEFGTSAFYSSSDSKLYVLSNSFTKSGFSVTTFTGTTPSTVTSTSKKYEQIFSPFNYPLGYSIKINTVSPNELLVAGMLSSEETATPNLRPFLVKIDRPLGFVIGDDYYEMPNSGFHNFGAPLLKYTQRTIKSFFAPQMLYAKGGLVNDPDAAIFGYRKENSAIHRLEMITQIAGTTYETGCEQAPTDIFDAANTLTFGYSVTLLTNALTITSPSSTSTQTITSQINCFEAPCVNEVANAGPDQVCFGSAIGTPALPGATYVWTSVPTTGITFSSTTVAQPVITSVTGSHTLTVTMTNRCKEVSTDVMTITNSGCRLAGTANNSEEQQQANVFPNPGNGTFTFNYQAEETDAVQVQILDMSGRSVASRSLTASGQQLTFDELADGIYIYQLTVNNKVVKQDRLIINR
jgi:Secretion system C-terminal sorting domain